MSRFVTGRTLNWTCSPSWQRQGLRFLIRWKLLQPRVFGMRGFVIWACVRMVRLFSRWCRAGFCGGGLMRMSFLITVTLCGLLLLLGLVWDKAAGSRVTGSVLQYVGEALASPDPRPEYEKGIFTRLLNAIAMEQHRRSTAVREL